MNREVTMELLEKYGKEFVQDRANRVAQNAVVGKGVNAAATDSGVERLRIHFLSAWSRVRLPTRKRAAAVGCSQP